MWGKTALNMWTEKEELRPRQGVGNTRRVGVKARG